MAPSDLESKVLRFRKINVSKMSQCARMAIGHVLVPHGKVGPIFDLVGFRWINLMSRLGILYSFFSYY